MSQQTPNPEENQGGKSNEDNPALKTLGGSFENNGQVRRSGSDGAADALENKPGGLEKSP